VCDISVADLFVAGTRMPIGAIAAELALALAREHGLEEMTEGQLRPRCRGGGS